MTLGSEVHVNTFWTLYCKLVIGLDACLCLQLLPFISLFLGDATNGVASLCGLSTWRYYTYYTQIRQTVYNIDTDDRLTFVESIFTIHISGQQVNSDVFNTSVLFIKLFALVTYSYFKELRTETDWDVQT